MIVVEESLFAASQFSKPRVRVVHRGEMVCMALVLTEQNAVTRTEKQPPKMLMMMLTELTW